MQTLPTLSSLARECEQIVKASECDTTKVTRVFSQLLELLSEESGQSCKHVLTLLTHLGSQCPCCLAGEELLARVIGKCYNFLERGDFGNFEELDTFAHEVILASCRTCSSALRHVYPKLVDIFDVIASVAEDEVPSQEFNIFGSGITIDQASLTLHLKFSCRLCTSLFQCAIGNVLKTMRALEAVMERLLRANSWECTEVLVASGLLGEILKNRRKGDVSVLLLDAILDIISQILEEENGVECIEEVITIVDTSLKLADDHLKSSKGPSVVGSLLDVIRNLADEEEWNTARMSLNLAFRCVNDVKCEFSFMALGNSLSPLLLCHELYIGALHCVIKLINRVREEQMRDTFLLSTPLDRQQLAPIDSLCCKLISVLHSDDESEVHKWRAACTLLILSEWCSSVSVPDDYCFSSAMKMLCKNEEILLETACYLVYALQLCASSKRIKVEKKIAVKLLDSVLKCSSNCVDFCVESLDIHEVPERKRSREDALYRQYLGKSLQHRTLLSWAACGWLDARLVAKHLDPKMNSEDVIKAVMDATNVCDIEDDRMTVISMISRLAEHENFMRIVAGRFHLFFQPVHDLTLWKNCFSLLSKSTPSEVRLLAFRDSLPGILRRLSDAQRKSTVTLDLLNTCIDALGDDDVEIINAAGKSLKFVLRYHKQLVENVPDFDKMLLCSVKEGLKSNHSTRRLAFVRVAGELAVESSMELQKGLLFMILSALVDSRWDIRAAAYDQVRRIGGVSALENIREEMYPALLEQILLRREELANELAVSLFKYPKSSDVIKELVEHSLPDIAATCNLRVLSALRKKVPEVASDVEICAFDHLDSIICRILFTESDENFARALDFLVSEILQNTCGPKELFEAAVDTLVVRVVKNFAFYSEEKVMHALETVRDVTSAESVVQLLKGTFLGVMHQLAKDMFMRGAQDEGKQADSLQQSLREGLLCIHNIILALRDAVKPFVSKMVSTLHEIAQLADGNNIRRVADVWYTFAAALTHENIHGHVGQFAGEVVPLLSRAPKEAARVLRFLIVESNGSLRQEFKAFPVLPIGIPELKEVYEALETAESKHSTEDELQSVISTLRWESHAVVIAGLQKVKELLGRRHRRDLYLSFLAHEDENHVGKQLMRALVSNSTSSDKEIRLLASECLGRLGAFDPSKLGIETSTRKMMEELEPFDIAIELISKYLLQQLRVVSEKVHDRAEFAVQELLKFCSGFFPGEGKAGELPQFFMQFPEDVRVVVEPFWGSRLKLIVADKARPARRPVFSLDEDSSDLKKWLSEWIGALYAKTSSEIQDIVRACRPILKHDSETGLFLLPYVVADVASKGSGKEHDDIVYEILAVLQAVISSRNLHIIGQHAQVVYHLTDALKCFVDTATRRIENQERDAEKKVQKGQSLLLPHDTDVLKSRYSRVSELLAKIPKDMLAKSAFESGAHTRAVMYMEAFLREEHEKQTRATQLQQKPFSNSTTVYSNLDFFQKVYSQIKGEPDGLEGFRTLRLAKGGGESIREQIRLYEKDGKWSHAMTCYEIALQTDPQNSDLHVGMLKCLRNLGHLQKMLLHVNGAISEMPTLEPELSPYGIQAAWRLGDWDKLENFMKGREETEDCESGLARGLLFLRCGNGDEFRQELRRTRESLLPTLAAACMESHQAAHDSIVRLHMLQELEDAQEVLDLKGDDSSQVRVELNNLSDEWKERLRLTESSMSVREPILSLRRAILSLRCGTEDEISSTWLEWARLSRKHGQLQTAYGALLRTRELGRLGQQFLPEQAKLLWELGEQAEALSTTATSKRDLQKLLVGLSKEEVDHVSFRLNLLGNRWKADTGRVTEKDAQVAFSQIVKENKRDTKAHYYAAKFYDRILSGRVGPSCSDMDFIRYAGQYLEITIKSYGFALLLGIRHVHECMARMLTLWFEYGARLWKTQRSASGEFGRGLGARSAASMLHATNTLIGRIWNSLPTYQWLTALPQLVSRIVTEEEGTRDLLDRILSGVLTCFPRQASWFVVPVSKSKRTDRNEACNRILSLALSDQHRGKRVTSMDGDTARQIIKQTSDIVDWLIWLCEYRSGSRQEKDDFKMELRRTGYHLQIADMRSGTTSAKVLKDTDVIVPTGAQMELHLPWDKNVAKDWEPFPTSPVTVSGVDDTVVVYPSLQLPKKIFFHGSDGEVYCFLCKPEDDLRKDARMMEFAAVVNRLFWKDPESRKRRLRLRTFSVVPLDERNGLVEWVTNTEVFTKICDRLYKRHRPESYVAKSKLRTIYGQKNDKMEDHVRFENEVLPLYRPIFYKWFLENFPDPSYWFESRLRFARSSAAWSVVGHIVGLGDRHGENIMLDHNTGETVHVDFNCLFNKGQSFAVKERVPFRMTQNMVDALGVTGTDGVFRRVCEIAMRVLRTNREALTHVLETFVHDPLVDWLKAKDRSAHGRPSTMEHTDPNITMRKLGERLEGVVDGTPMSVEGQVDRLIAEATNTQNLSRMFIWWLPAL